MAAGSPEGPESSRHTVHAAPADNVGAPAAGGLPHHLHPVTSLCRWRLLSWRGRHTGRPVGPLPPGGRPGESESSARTEAPLGLGALHSVAVPKVCSRQKSPKPGQATPGVGDAGTGESLNCLHVWLPADSPNKLIP